MSQERAEVDDSVECAHPVHAIMWNPWNKAVQCHCCGHVMEIPSWMEQYGNWCDEDVPDDEYAVHAYPLWRVKPQSERAEVERLTKRWYELHPHSGRQP